MAAAGTVTITKKSDDYNSVVTFTWIATALGAVAEQGFTANGYLVGMILIPDGASDAYDLTLLDEDGLDILNGAGANMSNAAGMTLAEKYIDLADTDGGHYFFMGEKLYPTIANGGDSVGGLIKFVFSKIHPGIKAVA